MTKSIDETQQFWDHRHRNRGPLQSGGYVSRSEAENWAFYLERMGLLSKLLGGMGGVAAGARLLDAGCGKGAFSAFLSDCGFEVVGVDASMRAIEEARTLHPGIRFECTTLGGFVPWPPFDVVVFVDVLFHILEDHDWESSLLNLAHSVRVGGILLVSDGEVEEPVDMGDYIRFRPPAKYDQVLTPLGFSRSASESYGRGASKIRFYSFVRG